MRPSPTAIGARNARKRPGPSLRAVRVASSNRRSRRLSAMMFDRTIATSSPVSRSLRSRAFPVSSSANTRAPSPSMTCTPPFASTTSTSMSPSFGSPARPAGAGALAPAAAPAAAFFSEKVTTRSSVQMVCFASFASTALRATRRLGMVSPCRFAAR